MCRSFSLLGSQSARCATESRPVSDCRLPALPGLQAESRCAAVLSDPPRRQPCRRCVQNLRPTFAPWSGDGRPTPQSVHRVDCDWITAVTASGWEISVRCEPPSYVGHRGSGRGCHRAFRSRGDDLVAAADEVPRRNGLPGGVASPVLSKAAVEAVRCVAHSRVAVSAGRSLPKLWRKMSFFR